MITESESSSSPPTAEATNDAAAAQHAEPHKASGGTERSEDVATSSLNSANDTSSLGVRKTSITSPDPTAYVAKARITRPTPPPPPYNPMQFVQIKPCNLYQTAQQQLKKAEEVKKIKEIKKEEPEDWQNNLDNWKSSRRKRVEHIIDRVVEVKKLEYEEYDRSRRKSKTFSEMIEERGERGVRVGRAKLASLAVYNEDESNDLSDLGIGTSSTSGKSSLSEEYDNNSVMSDNNDLEKANGLAANHLGTSIAREYVSSPGYDTSSSTAPASSPDPCEYTYESAIQDYKQRVSRAKLGSVTSLQRQTKTTSKESTPENDDSTPLNNYSARRGSKIEERLIGFEVNSPNDNIESSEKTIVDLPKINISKRKEIFENAVSNNSSYQLPTGSSEPKRQDSSDVSKVPLREHIKVEETFTPKTKVEVRRLSGDMTSVKDRLLSLEQQQQLANSVNGDARALQSRAIDISVPPLKERLTSLQNAASKDELKKPPVVLVDARQLEIMKDEEEHARQRKKQMDVAKSLESKALQMESETEDTADEMAVESRGCEIDRDDSGIQTADDIEEEQRGHVVPQLLSRTQEEKLDEAIAALAVEERQLEQATTVINKIEAESTQLSNVTNAEDAASPNTISPTASDELPRQMEFSVSSTNDSWKRTSDICRSSFGWGEGRVSRERATDGVSLNCNKQVSGSAITSASSETANCPISRKPSNEMVHARNLLQMFKETFKNDDELYEEAKDTIFSGKLNSIAEPATPQDICTPRSDVGTEPASFPLPMWNPSHRTATQIFRPVPESSPCTTLAAAIQTKNSATMSMTPLSPGPTGKPPMSPKSNPRSPNVDRKTDRQFSINGRVEIFNSKGMQHSAKSAASVAPKYASQRPNLVPFTPTPKNKREENLEDIRLHRQQQIPKMSGQEDSGQEVTPMVDGTQVQLSHMPNTQPDSQRQQTEVVACASPVTVVNPDELPKPNTVKALTKCFSTTTSSKLMPLAADHSSPQLAQPFQRGFNTHADVQKPESDLRKACGSYVEPKEAALSSSVDSMRTIETLAIVHSPPPMTPNSLKNLSPTIPIVTPSQIPPLVLCVPNESTLYKLASSASQSPATPVAQQQLSPTDAYFCTNFFSSSGETAPESSPSSASLSRQTTVEDVLCEKIDLRGLPPGQVPSTAYFEVMRAQVERCDKSATPSTGPDALMDPVGKPSSKPNSPIMAARAAHSKALIETCEKIIAEERQARSQISASIPTTPTSQKSTPILGRKSKIPKPIPCCIRGRENKQNALSATESENDDDDRLIARHHVVETQIKVTTTTPPASPRSPKVLPSGNNVSSKSKAKNIFDFLKRNFGHHAEDESNTATAQNLGPGGAEVEDAIKLDKIITVDNSKFYVASDEEVPPPLPLSPAPGNIEMDKTAVDEILEEPYSEILLDK